MQYLIIAYDHPEALPERMRVRKDHLAQADKWTTEGKLLTGIGILNDQKQLIGSVMLFNVESRHELDELLKQEIYLTAKIWKDVTIQPAQLGPSFLKNSEK